MKKKFIFFALILSVLCIGGGEINSLNAQRTITIGDGDATNYLIPTYTYYNYSMTQQIYTAAEINSGAGSITHIAIRPATSNISRNIIIYMENIGETAIPTESGSETYIVNNNPLYQGITNFGTSGEWKTIALTTPFEYDGKSNILLCISDITGNYKDSQYFYTDETSEYSSVTRYRDDERYYPTTEQYPIITSYSGTTVNYAKKERNQIQFTFGASVTISPESIALGDVRMCWTEKPVTATVEVAYENTDAPVITSSDDFFTVSYDASTSPFNLTIGYDTTKPSSTSGTITITSGELEKTITVTAAPYTPATGDVWESAPVVDLSTGTFNSGEVTGMYDDYILPGEIVDGNLNDAVYKFTLDKDALITATVEGTNAIAAIYKAEDLQDNGPSSDNNNIGVQSSPTASFFYDFENESLEDFNFVEYDGNNDHWVISDEFQVDNKTLVSYSYISGKVNEADNYIFTKSLYEINANSKLTFDAKCGGSFNGNWDKLMVKVSTDGEAFTLIETVNPASTSWARGITIDLGTKFAEKGLAYGDYFIALHHQQNSDIYSIIVDNLALTDGSKPQIDGVQYPAGTYYLVAAAEGDFTLNLKKKKVLNIFTGTGNWDDATKWSKGVPTENSEVLINGSVQITSNVKVKYLSMGGGYLTINSAASLTVTDELINTNPNRLIILDGGQLFHDSEDVQATFNMNIINPQNNVWNAEQKDGWQFIASPFIETEDNNNIASFANNNYDLYKYDGSKEGAEWRNHKAQAITSFESGVGYLASQKDKKSVDFTGTLNNETLFSTGLSYTADNDLANFHLLGNPFSFDMDMDLSKAKASYTNLVEGYAVINAAGNGYTYKESGTIPVGDGFFVKTTKAGASFSYNHNVRGTRGEDANSINVIATSNAGSDNVIIRFAGKEEGFDKLQNFDEAIATVYVSENGTRYGIYNCEDNVQEIALNFDAKEMGNYTISLDINGKFENVTLVDRFTGIETNMLIEDEYSFTATSNDSHERFFIRLDNGQESTENSHFVYKSGEELILTIEGSVQIVDMLGRVVYSNEHSDAYNRIDVSNFNNGTYVVRVINETGVKVEKVVIY